MGFFLFFFYQMLLLTYKYTAPCYNWGFIKLKSTNFDCLMKISWLSVYLWMEFLTYLHKLIRSMMYDVRDVSATKQFHPISLVMKLKRHKIRFWNNSCLKTSWGVNLARFDPKNGIKKYYDGVTDFSYNSLVINL